MPQLAQILLGGQLDAVPALGIAGLVQDEDPGGVRPQIRVCLPQLQALDIDGLGLPRRIMQEVMQPLALGPRNEGRQLDQRTRCALAATRVQ